MPTTEEHLQVSVCVHYVICLMNIESESGSIGTA
jgi:hypothetical protein